MLRWLLPLVVLAMAAQAQQPVRVAASARAGVEVFAAVAAWCAERPAFTVVAERAEAFTGAAFADAMQRVGTLVESECPAARAVSLSGMVRGNAEPVWRGSVEAGAGWALRADVAPPVLTPTNPVSLLVTRLDAAGQAKAMAAIGSRFGAYNVARQCIPVALQEPEGNTAACLKIERAFRVEADGTVRVHVLLSGPGASNCHACSGMIAFAALDATGPDWTLVAASKPLRSGSFGIPTDARYIELHRLGLKRWGWTETTSYTGCGETLGFNLVFLVGRSAITEAGQLSGDSSNMGNCEGGRANGGPCVEKTVTLTVDTSDAALDAYPIVLRSVTKTGRRVLRQDLIARFNPAQQKWVEPDLPRR